MKEILEFLNYRVRDLKSYILCFVSAVLLILSFANFNIWIFAWFGFVPLFFAIQNKSKGKAFFISYLAGLFFWLGTIYWLINVSFIGLIVLVLYLALYFGIFGLIVSTINYRLSTIKYLLIASVWVVLEYLRSKVFTGFGWASLGYSQYLNLPIIQIADVTGVWGVSFIIILVNVGVWQLIAELRTQNLRLKINWREGRRTLFAFFVCMLCFLSILGYGYYKLHHLPLNTPHSPLRISVIQGNIPQELKWQESFQAFILEEYIQLTKKASLHKPDLIIWPEAAVPGFLFHREDDWIFQNISNLAKELKTNFLLGTVVKNNSDYFNSAVLLDTTGEIIKRYDKLHLVPFGEYIPLKKIFGFLGPVVPIGDFVSGKEYTVFQIPNPKSQIPNNFSVLICFEDLFPDLSRRFVKKGAGFLVNITNDAWFGKTSSPFQHVGLSVFRAVENRRFLIRAANTGVSCFISPGGAIKSLVLDDYGRAIFIPNHKTDTVYYLDNTTFYTRYGDIFVLICLILIIYGIIIGIYFRFRPLLVYRWLKYRRNKKNF